MNDYNALPIGFGMALAMNPPAFNAYSSLTAEEKETLYTVLGKLQADWQERFPRCTEKSGE